MEIIFERDPNDFEFHKSQDLIYKGSTRKVYKVRDKKLKEEVVLKRIKLNNPELKAIEELKASHGDLYLGEIRDKNIIPYYGYFFDHEKPSLSIIMKYCEKGSLAERIEKFKSRDTKIPDGDILRWSEELFEVLWFLKRNDIIHNDIKPHNMLLYENKKEEESIYLIDMGETQLATRTQSMTKGSTLLFKAPERFKKDTSCGTHQSDIWSAGISIFQLIHLRLPFEDVYDILLKPIDEIKFDGSRIVQLLKDMILRMLRREPAERKEALEYLTDFLAIRKKNEPLTSQNISLLTDCMTICPLTTLDNIKADLEKKGVVVLPNVFSAEECDNVRNKVYEFLASEFKVIEPDDYRKLNPLEGMIVKNYGVALRPEILQMKTDERVVEPFRRIWNDQELTTSFDAITILGPPEKSERKLFFDIERTWFHTDQSPNKKGFACVQAFINLEETSEGDGCLSVLLDSHFYHEEFFKKFKLVSQPDYFEIYRSHKEWYTKEKGCKWAMISAPKGSMVFWDSRTINMETEPLMGRPNPDRWRFVAYVCYMPAMFQSKEDAEKKRKAYLQYATTTHWPYGVKFEGYHPLCRKENDLTKLTRRQKKLFGIE